MSWLRAGIVALGLALSACVQPIEQPPATVNGVSLFALQADMQWRLPARLAEVSGLALTPDGRLFGHGDEAGVIYEISMAHGRLVKRFTLGDSAVRADFEALAITDTGDFYLATSTGQLYRFREGAAESHVAFEVIDTGLRDVCEIEGLAFLRAEQSLILACKTNYADDMRNSIALYAWSLRDQSLRPWRSLPEAPIAQAAGAQSFHPSEIAIDPGTGRLILLAGRERAIAEFDADGTLRAARALPPDHRQPEGAVVLKDGALAITDEAAGAQALITRYPRAHD